MADGRLVDAVGKLRRPRCGTSVSVSSKMRSMAARMVSRPYLSNSSSMRRAASRQAAICDFMSPSEDSGKADVVLEHAVERLVELAFAVDLELIELQSLEPGIDHARAGAETGGAAADVDPVRAHHREHQQLALVEIGHVDDDVVEVLAGDRLVVGDDDVARLEALGAVALHAVDDDDAEVGDEVRDAADILRDQLALGVEQRGADSRAPRRSSCCRRCAAGRPPSRWRRRAARCG